MCGICGFVGSGSPEDLARMMATLVHRGPDGEGTWIDEKNQVFFGHRRLSIVDLTTGDQPMATADGDLMVIFNGEIYNHRELRLELEKAGHVFRSDHSDTEVLLHGFRAWGSGLPLRLNGMWAFAIYDRARAQIFVSRDRFGKKPFFYSCAHGGFAFGSELETVRAHRQIRPRLSLSTLSLKKYFGYGYIPAPRTLWENVWKLPAGHSLWLSIAEPAQPRLERYWNFTLEPIPIENERTAEQRTDELRDAIDRAVVRRLAADVPVGVFLSGGIDSSLVTALAARHLPERGLQTFCIGFEKRSFDESRFAREVAVHCQTSHHEKFLSIEHARTLLPTIVEKLDEPMGDSSLLPTSLLCQFARKHVKVALGGDGGDELFAGYDPFRALRAASAYARWMPRPVHAGISALVNRLPVSHRNMSFDFKLKRFLRGAGTTESLRLPTWMAPLTTAQLADLFQEPIDPEVLFSEAIDTWEECAQANPVDRTLQFYTRLYLQDDILVKADRASMMHGLEVRAPLLDIEVIDLARKIPANWKYRHGETKHILKRVAQEFLPPHIINRAKKGFGMPVGDWFKRESLELARPPINQTFAMRLQTEHVQGRSDQRAFLWNMWVLENWLKTHSA